MGVEFQQISRDAQRALEDFSNEFAAAFTQGDVDQWAKELGLSHTSTALKTTYPIPISAAGYHEFKGDVKYRSLFEKSLELMPKTWQDGIAELASVIEAPDFIGWAEQPAAIAAAGLALPNEIIAELLEANPLCWDGQNYFDSDHPINVLRGADGTFQNDFTGAGTDLNSTNLGLAKQFFRQLKGANKKVLGLRMTHIMVGAAKEEQARDLLERDLIIEAAGGGVAAVDNRHKGSVKLVVADELQNDDRWYPLALNKPGLYPWIVQDEGAPEELRSDKDSHLYKTTLKVGLAYILRGNGGLALPQAIQRWAGQSA